MNRPVKILLLVVVLFIILPASQAYGDGEEVDLILSPEIFQVAATNLKPGDTVTKELIISNAGSQSIHYHTNAEMIQGSRKFFNELFVEIKLEDRLIFNGKILDLKQFEPRSLAVNDSERLMIKVIVPTTLGNDFQGLGCVIEWSFYAEFLSESVIAASNNLPIGNELPNTATNTAHTFLVGISLLVIGILVLKWKRKER